MALQVITPPEAISQKIYKESINIFLAGSIEIGKAEDWQQTCIDYLDKRWTEDAITLLNPRRKDWDSKWKQGAEEPNFYQQVNWELNALDKSKYIIMYFDPNTKSPISLLELGLYAKSGKLLVCCPKGFYRRGNVEVVCEKYNIPFFNSLTVLLQHVKPL